MQIPQERIKELELKIKPSIDRLNERRIADKRKARNIAIALTVVGAVVVTVFNNGGSPLGAIVGVLFLGLLAYFMIYSIYKSFHNKTYKAEVVPELVEAIIPGAKYSKKGVIKKSDIKEAKIYSFSGKDMNTEDSIVGRIDKTDFSFNEVNIYHAENDGDGGTRRVVDLLGFVFVADFNKHFQGHTVLSSKKRHLDIGFFSSYQKCVLEDVDFERLFTTYTTDDQQARYILTPALQQRITELHSYFDHREMAISFLSDKMMILVNSGTNHFEVKYDTDEVMSDLYALSLLGDIVEQMNLNLRIWSKE